MSYRNFINLDNKSLDKSIYRILPIGRFIQLLTTKSLTLVKPHKWDDPFENLLLSSGLKYGSNSIPISARNSVYAQCWTWHRETDAMWRIYSANKDGVRLRSTPRKLLTALRTANPTSPELRCFIGEVEYIFKKRLETKYAGINILDPNGSGIAESLLIKRKQFSHEKEVRLIYVAEDHQHDNDIFGFSIDPSTDIDRILFDPRMSKDLRLSYRKTIRALGYESEIKRSTLYDPPKLLFSD